LTKNLCDTAASKKRRKEDLILRSRGLKKREGKKGLLDRSGPKSIVGDGQKLEDLGVSVCQLPGREFRRAGTRGKRTNHDPRRNRLGAIGVLPSKNLKKREGAGKKG